MIEWIGHAELLPGFEMKSALYVDDIGEQPPADAGVWAARNLYLSGTCSGGRYLLTNPRYYEEEIGIVVAEDGSIPCAKPVVQFEGLKSGRTWATSEAVGQKIFSRTAYLANLHADAIRWEILYSGRSGNEVTLDYREYAFDNFRGAFARPAFFQQVKYDLGTSRMVSFRDVKIEILDATNSGIRYRVVEDGRRR